MKFSEITYVKPDFEKFKVDFNKKVNALKKAKNYQACKEALKAINDLRNDLETTMTVVSIRNSINTADEVYEKAQEEFDEISPLYSELINDYYKVLYNSKFKDEFKKEYGDLIFKQIEVQLKTFSPAIIEDLIEENKLSTAYSKLVASCQIEFDGKTLNLSQMAPYSESLDRNVRFEASKAKGKWFVDHLDEFDSIYDKLVRTRTRIAHKLGYKNFVQLGYDRLGRVDYTPSDVKNYREQIYHVLVPIAQELIKKQEERIKINSPLPFDYNLEFLTGNAKPKGNKDELVDSAKMMYDEMSTRTSSFFRFLVDSELMDLETKPNKQGGGYCTFLQKYEMPFIFSNFNGTSGDVDVLTHEFGHAFQAYSARKAALPEYIWPTLEACEIHSMSMEFFAYPWMDKFFDNPNKYRYSHLKSAITFIPYGAAVDEFQTFVYENYEASPRQRREKWLEIHKKYEPNLKFEQLDYYKEGIRFFAQSHIFTSPFYYIDYTLAQVCAFQFKNMMDKDYNSALNTYFKLCDLGGSKSFVNLLKTVGLEVPFNQGCIKKVMAPLEKAISEVDDKSL